MAGNKSLFIHDLVVHLRLDRSYLMGLKKPPTTMRHSLNDLYYTPPISLYCSPSRQCLKFVMKPPTYNPTQNLPRVPSSRISAL
jgi:hypothetical protein